MLALRLIESLPDGVLDVEGEYATNDVELPQVGIREQWRVLEPESLGVARDESSTSASGSGGAERKIAGAIRSTLTIGSAGAATAVRLRNACASLSDTE